MVRLPMFPLYLDKQLPYFCIFDSKIDLNLCFVTITHGELAACSGLMPSSNTSPSPFTCMNPLLSEPEDGLPGMTSEPRPPMVETAAAAATAGATVGAVGDIEELGEKASLRVYDPPPG